MSVPDDPTPDNHPQKEGRSLLILRAILFSMIALVIVGVVAVIHQSVGGNDTANGAVDTSTSSEPSPPPVTYISDSSGFNSLNSGDPRDPRVRDLILNKAIEIVHQDCPQEFLGYVLDVKSVSDSRGHFHNEVTWTSNTIVGFFKPLGSDPASHLVQCADGSLHNIND